MQHSLLKIIPPKTGRHTRYRFPYSPIIHKCIIFPPEYACYNIHMSNYLTKRELPFWIISLLFVVSITIGGLFRFYNLNWDKGHLFHPDERNIALAVTRIRFFSHMNPEFYAYGSLPIYIFRATGDAMSYISHDSSWVNDWGKINLIERWYSALFSTLTLVTVFIIGRKIISNTVGILAMWCTAFTPLLIRQAHFGVTESMITFFGTLIVLMSLRLLNHPTWLKILSAGIIFGLSVATKASCITFGIIPISALLLSQNRLTSKKKHVLLKILHCALLASVAFGVYSVISPYTFLSWGKFKESMDYEGGIVWGKRIVVYVYQFLDTTPYLYQIKQLFFTQGVFPAILSLIGFSYVVIKTIRHVDKKIFVVFIWPLVYFVIVGAWYAKFVRYMVPVYPFLALASAVFVNDILSTRIYKGIKIGILSMALTMPLFYSFALMNIYTTKQTRISASEWMYDHIPPKTHILTEHWDDGLPVSLPGNNREPNRFASEQITIYEPDNAEKITYYGEKLNNAEYIIINSRRLYGTLMRLTDKYPVTSKYYKRLFNGDLGYEKVAEFAVYPGIHIGPLNLTLNDDNSEESFQVYDHPKVMIFKNIQHYPAKQISGELQ